MEHSLVVFAVCVSTFERGFSLSGLLKQLVGIAVFIPVILIGVGELGARILRKVEKNEDAYFIVILAIVAVAGLLADGSACACACRISSVVMMSRLGCIRFHCFKGNDQWNLKKCG